MKALNDEIMDKEKETLNNDLLLKEETKNTIYVFLCVYKLCAFVTSCVLPVQYIFINLVC